jgi:hypothetical protein
VAIADAQVAPESPSLLAPRPRVGLRPLKRFWWVFAIGVALSIGAAIVILRSNPPTYSATARLFVTSPEAPYFRTSVPRLALPRRSSISGTQPTTVRETPNVTTLTGAANIYPLLIESDQVVRQREKMFGQLEGTVTARAIFAVETASRFSPSDIPVIEIYAEDDDAAGAIKLAQSTAVAFTAWIRNSQQEAGIRRSDRIQIQQIQHPVGATSFGGASRVPAVLVVLAAVLGFGVVIVVLDRVFPPRAAQPAEGGAATPSVHEPSPLEGPLATYGAHPSVDLLPDETELYEDRETTPEQTARR